MALPPQIQKQVEQAESILQQVNEPAMPAVSEASPEPQPAPAPVPVAPEPAPAPADAELASKFAQLEQRYKSLQGIHRGYEDKIRTLEARLNQAVQELEAARKPSVPETPAIDPKDAEVFGTDLVDMVKRVAESMFGSAAKSFDARLAAIEQRLEGTATAVAKTAEETFYERLKALVPDWEDLNTSDGFLAWLAEEDPIYGVPRQNALTAAGQALDVNRVAKVFLAYKATLAPAAPTPSSSLNRQVAPSSAASAPAKMAGKPTFTVAEVQQFYKDQAQGRYRGREQDAARLEAQYNDALAEGRIVDRPMRVATV